MTKNRKNSHQMNKFKKAARELEADESEEAFDEKLRKIAKAPPPKEKAAKQKPGK